MLTTSSTKSTAKESPWLRKPAPLPPQLVAQLIHLHNVSSIPQNLMMSLQRYDDDIAKSTRATESAEERIRQQFDRITNSKGKEGKGGSRSGEQQEDGDGDAFPADGVVVHFEGEPPGTASTEGGGSRSGHGQDAAAFTPHGKNKKKIKNGGVHEVFKMPDYTENPFGNVFPVAKKQEMIDGNGGDNSQASPKRAGASFVGLPTSNSVSMEASAVLNGNNPFVRAATRRFSTALGESGKFSRRGTTVLEPKPPVPKTASPKQNSFKKGNTGSNHQRSAKLVPKPPAQAALSLAQLDRAISVPEVPLSSPRAGSKLHPAVAPLIKKRDALALHTQSGEAVPLLTDRVPATSRRHLHDDLSVDWAIPSQQQKQEHQMAKGGASTARPTIGSPRYDLNNNEKQQQKPNLKSSVVDPFESVPPTKTDALHELQLGGTQRAYFLQPAGQSPQAFTRSLKVQQRQEELIAEAKLKPSLRENEGIANQKKTDKRHKNAKRHQWLDDAPKVLSSGEVVRQLPPPIHNVRAFDPSGLPNAADDSDDDDEITTQAFIANSMRSKHQI